MGPASMATSNAANDVEKHGVKDSENSITNTVENIFRLGPWHLRVIHNEQRIEQASFIMPTSPSASPFDPSVRAAALAPSPVAECIKGAYSAMTQAVVSYLNDYLNYRTPVLTLPLASSGSLFRQRVWTALRAIPAGSKMTYGQLATLLESAAQPVGGACRHNPIAFFTPCHRIVSATGLGGFMGLAQSSPQLQCKAWLLQHEQGFNHV